MSPKAETAPPRCACLGILAGSGALPRAVAEACRAAGQPLFVIDLEGRAADWAGAYPGTRLPLGQPGRALRALRAAGCDAVTMAGGLARPSFRSMRLDRTALSLMPRLLRFARGGDDALLSGIAALFEERGFRVVAPEAFLAPSMLAPAGRIAGPEPGGGFASEAARARAVLSALAPFDIGQAVAVSELRVLAVEGPEGTAEMLARVGSLAGRTPGGTLVKAPKAGQDARVDRPVIGPETVAQAAQAGLVAIAVEAGGVLLLDCEALCAAAERHRIAVHGFDPEEG